MLLFRYIVPNEDIPERTVKVEIKSLKENIKERKSKSSTDIQRNWGCLFNQVCSMKRIVQTEKDHYMQNDFLPESLKPFKLEPFPGTFTECCLFLELLDEYRKYLVENKIDIGSARLRMEMLIQTVIVIKENVAIVLTEDKNLKKILKNKISEYEKFGIVYSEEENLI